jgi:hypothetical protein
MILLILGVVSCLLILVCDATSKKGELKMQAFNAMFELSSAICLSIFLFIVLPYMWLKGRMSK